MNHRTAARAAAALRATLLALGLAATGAAQAAYVLDSGVDASTRRFLIDAGSTLTFTPGGFSLPGPGGGPAANNEPTVHALSGSFDAVVSHFGWQYRLDGDPQGTLGTFLWESTWIQFVSPQWTGPALPSGFQFPNYLAAYSGGAIAGDDTGCSAPYPPDTFVTCAINASGPGARLSGQWTDATLSIDGQQWTSAFAGDRCQYRIVATAAPVVTAIAQSGTMTLAALALGLLAVIGARRRSAART